MVDIHIPSIRILTIHLSLLKSELQNKTIVEETNTSKGTFSKIQRKLEVFLQNGIKRDVKLKADRIEWDELHVCRKNSTVSRELHQAKIQVYLEKLNLAKYVRNSKTEVLD